MFFNNGSTKEQAIIVNAPSDKLGVDAEYKHLESIYGEQNIFWRLQEQQLMISENKYYDVLNIELRNGNQLSYWFDINSFYGKE